MTWSSCAFARERSAGLQTVNIVLSRLCQTVAVSAGRARNALPSLLLSPFVVFPSAMAPKIAACGACGEPSSRKCGRCKDVHYCSQVCQSTDWKAHKAVCKAPVTSSLSIVAAAAASPDPALDAVVRTNGEFGVHARIDPQQADSGRL